MSHITHGQTHNLQKMFDTLSEGYDNPPLRFFPDSASHLPRYAGLKGNEHVLDVATGTGHSALALAEALPNGRVTGIDFSEGMLANARLKINDRAIRNVDLRTMDMQALEFPDGSFDAAVFAFSLFFVDDMEGLLRHVTEKVRQGGRVLSSSFSKVSFFAQSDLYFRRLKDYGVEPPAERWRISTPEECAFLFEKSGLTEVRVDTEDVGYFLTSAEDWWEIVWNTAFRKFLGGLAPDELSRFREEHLKDISGLATGNGIPLDVKVLYTQGVRGV